jgi:hypothetical protein
MNVSTSRSRCQIFVLSMIHSMYRVVSLAAYLAVCDGQTAARSGRGFVVNVHSISTFVAPIPSGSYQRTIKILLSCYRYCRRNFSLVEGSVGMQKLSTCRTSNRVEAHQP